MIKILYSWMWIFCLLLTQNTYAGEKNGITSKVKKSKKYKYDLAICAIFRDEAPYLKEWIEFHRLLGVEHFYLYNNRSSDDYKTVLKHYIKKGIVELTDWNYSYENIGRWSPIQCSSYTDCMMKNKGKVKWLAILDIDEFLFPVQENNLVDFLADYEEFGGLGVNWQMYGTSHISKIPEKKLLIEALWIKADKDYLENQHVKCVVQPDKATICRSPHFVDYEEGFYHVDANKKMFEGPHTSTVDVSKIRINHYWSRDEDFFNRVKIGRRQGWQEGIDNLYQRVDNLNNVEDRAIERFVPALRKKVFKK